MGAVRVWGATYTGTLIDRQHVLTAAHVFGDASAKDVTVQWPQATGMLGIGATALIRHPRYAFGAKPYPRNDLAIIRLERDAPGFLRHHEPDFSSTRAGAVLTLVGYGASGQGSQGVSAPANPGIRRVGSNVLDALLAEDGSPPRPPDRPPAIFLYDFDGPAAVDGRSQNPLGSGTLGNGVETMAAPGDSGAPAFVRMPGGIRFIGILGFVAERSPEAGAPTAQAPARSRFGAIGGGYLLAAHRRWIEAVQSGRMA